MLEAVRLESVLNVLKTSRVRFSKKKVRTTPEPNPKSKIPIPKSKAVFIRLDQLIRDLLPGSDRVDRRIVLGIPL